jgi:pyruvate kinase
VKQWLSEHGLAKKLAIQTEGPSSKHPETNHRMEIIDLHHSSREGDSDTET